MNRALSSYLKRSILLALLIFEICSNLHAHPHVFVDYNVTAVFDESGLSGFKMEWWYDGMTSAGILMDYDTDGDGELGKSEVSALEKASVNHLINNKFITVRVDDSTSKVNEFNNLKAKMDNECLYFSFMVPCHAKAAAAEKVVMISVNDKEYYVDFMLSNPIMFNAPSSITYSTESQTERQVLEIKIIFKKK